MKINCILGAQKAIKEKPKGASEHLKQLGAIALIKEFEGDMILIRKYLLSNYTKSNVSRQMQVVVKTLDQLKKQGL